MPKIFIKIPGNLVVGHLVNYLQALKISGLVSESDQDFLNCGVPKDDSVRRMNETQQTISSYLVLNERSSQTGREVGKVAGAPSACWSGQEMHPSFQWSGEWKSPVM